MKNSIAALLIVLLLQSCNNEPKKEADVDNNTLSKYETYGYAGFTKEQMYQFHKHLYEGGNWTVYGDTERYFYLNFSEVQQHSRILQSATPKILEEAPRADVKNYRTPTDLKKGGGLTLNDYVQQVEVNGLIIVHKGKIVFEGYPRMYPTDLHVNFLITQVYVSTAIAILEDRGLIDTSKPVDHYFDVLNGTGWEGVPIVDILSMSSGVDPASMAIFEPSFDPLNDVATAVTVAPPGTKYQFSNADAMVLTLLVEKVSGLRFRDFVEQEIWNRIGAEHSALLAVNTNGTSLAYLDGLSTTLRDLARFGLAFTPSGRMGDHPLISDAHLFNIRDVNENLLKKSRYSDETVHTNYQWSAVYEDGDFYKGAHGGQGLYISPAKDLVIAFYGTSNTNRERNQLDVISRQLSKSGLFDLE